MYIGPECIVIECCRHKSLRKHFLLVQQSWIEQKVIASICYRAAKRHQEREESMAVKLVVRFRSDPSHIHPTEKKFFGLCGSFLCFAVCVFFILYFVSGFK